MSQKFVKQLERVCRRRRRQRWLTATCSAAAAAALVVLTLIGLDYALGIDDLVGRVIWTMLLVGIGWRIGAVWLRAVSEAAESPLRVAHDVERQHPELRGMVGSAWEFDQQATDDPIAGSESLRRAVVRRAAAASDEVDWQQLVSRRSLGRAMLALAIVVVTSGGFAWYLPKELAIGLTRLTNPLSRAEWPREHDLQFVEPPLQLAAGKDLVLRLRDTHGDLPSSVTMHYRSGRQGTSRDESQLLETKNPLLEIRLANVQQSFQFRATGGDHRTMPWQSLEVVAAPRVETCQLTVHPPAYTNLPAQIWDRESVLYAGSQLALQGQTDQVVTEVILRSTKGGQLEAEVGSRGRSFRVEPADWRITESATWTAHFTTASGLQARSAIEWALEVVIDQAPQVRFVEPTNDLTVVPNVSVPLVIEAIDELAVREIELIIHLPDRSECS